MSNFAGRLAKSLWPQDIWQLGAASVEEASRVSALADVANIQRSRCRWMPYWTAEAYGFGRILRAYGFYPAFLPLCVDTDHGPQLFYRLLETELETNSPCILVHNRAALQQWKHESSKLCHVMSSPSVLFRRRHRIEQSPEAKGLLFFPAHSTDHVEERTSMDQYIELLHTAPTEFGPVAVCLYWVDVVKGRHWPFLAAQIPVFTAGHPFDRRFMERFYGILRHFRYTASNELGSYAFYAVEMGVPFSLCGPSPTFWNTGDKNVPTGLYEEPSDLQPIKEIFASWNHNITAEQKQFALSLLGQDAVPSRGKMCFWLYRSLFQTICQKMKKVVRGTRDHRQLP